MVNAEKVYTDTMLKYKVAVLTYDIGVCEEYMNALFKCRLFRDEGMNDLVRQVIRLIDNEKTKKTDVLNKIKMNEVQ